VLFPQPDEPTRATVVSAATRRVRPRRTWMQIRDHQRAIRGHPRPSSEGHQRSSEGRQRVIRRSPQVIRGPSERISHAAYHMRSEAAAPADRKPLGSSEVTRRSSEVIRPPHRPIDSRWEGKLEVFKEECPPHRRLGHLTAPCWYLGCPVKELKDLGRTTHSGGELHRRARHLWGSRAPW